MMSTADQIVAHLVGDYLIQSHWMANEKTKRSLAAALHAITYTLPFLLITLNPWALVFICGTHFLIDRYRLARFVVAFKNRIGDWRTKPASPQWPHGDEYEWSELYDTGTGYPADTPPWLATWLLIIADNTLHIICNGLAIHYLA